jgi:hypothetical protein
MNKHENILSSNDNKIKNVIDLNELIFRKLRIVILKPMTINHLSSFRDDYNNILKFL